MTVIDRDAESELGAMARTYAAAELLVFPLWWPVDGVCACPGGKLAEANDDFCGLRSDGSVNRSPGKHPMTRNGVNGANAHEQAIYRWWQKYPQANIGVPAGANNLAILDIDPRHDGDESFEKLSAACAELGSPLPTTPTQITGSSGRHIVYTAPEGGVKNMSESFGPDLPGLDTRGRGGYVVAAPSVHACGTAYAWANFLDHDAPWPAVLTKLMDWRADEPRPSRPARTARPQGGGYAEAALRGELERIRGAGKGTRNDVLNRAAFSLGQLVADGQLDEEAVRDELVSAGTAAGLTFTESAKTVESGLRGGAQSPRRAA